MRWLKDRNNREKWLEFREARRIAVVENRRKKRQSMNEMLHKIEEERLRGNARSQYKRIKDLRKGFQPRNKTIKDAEGRTVCGRENVERRWTEHFCGLFNRPNPDEPILEQYPENMDEVPAPTREDVRRSLAKLKNHKAPGPDRVQAELLKYGGAAVEEHISNLISHIRNTETIPEAWEEGCITVLHKNGDKNECANYRGITLLSVGYKILTQLLYNHLVIICDNQLGEYHAGFRTKKSTTDQIFILREIFEKYREYNKPHYHIFIDFKQAYDSIHRESLWNIMAYFDIPSKLIRLVTACYSNSRVSVMVNGNQTEAFNISGGLRQGCPLSTLLFNLVLEWVMRHSPQSPTALRIGDVIIDRLAYADDVDMCDEELDNLDATVSVFGASGKRAGLGMNMEKTKVMLPNREEPVTGDFMFSFGEVEGVANFKYLGSLINFDNDLAVEVEARIASASRSSWSLSKLLRSRRNSRRTKVQVYVSVIRPILTYGGETWALTDELSRRLEVFERSILRRILGPVFDPDLHAWRVRHNEEVYRLCDLSPVTSILRSMRLRWAGHLARMDDDSPPKRCFLGRPDGRRPPGRPRKRWEDVLRTDLSSTGMRNVRRWMERAADRQQWRHLVVAARDHRGPAPAE